MEQFSSGIINFIFSPNFHGWLAFARIAFIIVGALLFGFIIFALTNTLWLKRLILWDLQEFFTYRPFGTRRVIKDWSKTKARLDMGLESEYKLALIEADSLLDDILKKMNFSGENVGERLEKLTVASLSNLEELKAAHKVRNNIVHDPDYHLTLEEAKKTIGAYEKAMIDLQVI